MKITKENLWQQTPGMCEEIPTITVYEPDNKTHNSAVVIMPGGGYAKRAPHEGDGYARFLAENGYTAFVVDYRVSPHRFPLPLLDSRRGMRYARYYADKFGIDNNKIAIMGSSAGGHLSALTSTYFDCIDFEGTDEMDKEDFIPNAQILCYPVINTTDDSIAHGGSVQNLLGIAPSDECTAYSPEIIASEKTPQAFIWHTFSDDCVNVNNSLNYAKKLKELEIPVEMHIFPKGGHGAGLATNDDDVSRHISQWSGLLLNWLESIGF